MPSGKKKPAGNPNERANGLFAGTPGPGRTPGIPNKTTGVLKEAILIAAANMGDKFALDALEKALEAGSLIEANGGLVGYLEQIAVHEPKSFASLLGRVLPLVLAGSVDHIHHEIVEQRANKFTEAMQSLIERAESKARPN